MRIDYTQEPDRESRTVTSRFWFLNNMLAEVYKILKVEIADN